MIDWQTAESWLVEAAACRAEAARLRAESREFMTRFYETVNTHTPAERSALHLSAMHAKAKAAAIERELRDM